MNAKSLWILPLLLILLAGCDKEDEPLHMDDHVCADITVITPLSGLGDNGYNDEALAGVMDVDCSLFSKRVPFSVVIDVRSVVKDYVSHWNAGGKYLGSHGLRHEGR